MVSYDISSIIVRLCEQFFNQHTIRVVGDRAERDFSENPFAQDRDLGLHFEVRVECHNCGYSEKDEHVDGLERSFYKSLHFIIVNRHNVFLSTHPLDGSLQYSPLPLDSWKNTSNHDSCYRSDGIESHITQAYFEAAEFCWGEKTLKKEGLEKHARAPKNAEVRMKIGASLGDSIFDVVRVKRERLPDGYRQKLTSVEKVQVLVKI